MACHLHYPSWGLPGAFDRRRVRSLTYNRMEGGLPAAWGATGALQELRELGLSANQLQGPLPQEWGTSNGLQALQVRSSTAG